MADDPQEAPLPRGSYTFNWDDFDESMDPFQPRKSLMSNSPPSKPTTFVVSREQPQAPKNPTSSATKKSKAGTRSRDVVAEKHAAINAAAGPEVLDNDADVNRNYAPAASMPSAPRESESPSRIRDASPSSSAATSASKPLKTSTFTKKKKKKPPARDVDAETRPPPPEIDFDAIDDPFKPKKALRMDDDGAAPPPASKIDFDAIEDPFKPKRALKMDDDATPAIDAIEVDTKGPSSPRDASAADAPIDGTEDVHKVSNGFSKTEEKDSKPEAVTLDSPTQNTNDTREITDADAKKVDSETSSPPIAAPEFERNKPASATFVRKKKKKPKTPASPPPPEMDFDSIEDPFKAKKSLMMDDGATNSPPEINYDSIEDPFKSKKCLMDDGGSGSANAVSAKREKEAKVVEIDYDSIEDPFKPKKSLMIDDDASEKSVAETEHETKPASKAHQPSDEVGELKAKNLEVKKQVEPKLIESHPPETPDKTETPFKAVGKETDEDSVAEKPKSIKETKRGPKKPSTKIREMMAVKKAALKSKGEETVSADDDPSSLPDSPQNLEDNSPPTSSAPSPPLSRNGRSSTVAPDLIVTGKPQISEELSDEDFKPALDHFVGDKESLLDDLELRYSGSARESPTKEEHTVAGQGVDLLTGSPAVVDRRAKDGPVASTKSSSADANKMRLQEMRLLHEAKLLEREKAFEEEKRLFKQREDELLQRLESQQTEYDALAPQQEEMAQCLEEYEKTIQQLIADRESTADGYSNSLAFAIKERDATLEELNSVERSFSDLHRRYDKMKTLIEGYQHNEEALKACAEDWRQRLLKEQERYQVLKNHAEDKLEAANQEIDAEKKRSAAEIAKLQAALRKVELKCGMLERSLQSKTRENEELTAICDELINKVGPA